MMKELTIHLNQDHNVCEPSCDARTQLVVQGPGSRVQGPGSRVQGPGSRVQGPGSDGTTPGVQTRVIP